MRLFPESASDGARIFASVAATLLLSISPATSAETVATVNGAEIDSSVLDLYIQTRTQRPAAQATAEQRSAMLSELRDIYLLATQPVAESIRNREEIQAQIELQNRSLIAQTVAGEYVSRLAVTDEEIEGEYASQRELAPPLQYKARHILVESQGEAASIIDELDDGADFETLAKERSTGPSGPNGGDLGWFSPNQMVAPFSNAVQALDNGAYTKTPVQTDFGWHVILREDSRESEAPPLESVRENLRQAIQQRKFQAYLEQLRDAASE